LGQVVFVLLVVGGLGIFFYRHFGGAMLAKKPTQKAVQKPEHTLQHSVEGAGAGRLCARNDAAEPPEKLEPELDETSPGTSDLNARITVQVTRTPGMLQTDIYARFPEENRKALQAVLLRMDRSGALKREREGSSYRLFVG